MGKLGKARKRARRSKEISGDHEETTASADAAAVEAVEKSSTGSAAAAATLDAENLRTTEQTLRSLLESPDMLRSNQARVVRSLAFAIVEACSSNGNSGASGNSTIGTGGFFAKSLSGRIGDALHDGRWKDAIELLLLMNQQQSTERTATSSSPSKTTADATNGSPLAQPVPLGALQRWIRDLFEPGKSITVETSCQLLYLILKSTGQTPSGTPDEELALEGPEKKFPMWFATLRASTERATCNTINDNDTNESSWKEPSVEPVSVESAWKDGMTLWTTTRMSLACRILDPVASTLQDAALSKSNVPFVPGAFVMNHVLSVTECRRIVQVAHKMGFTPEASYSTTSSVSPTAAATTPTSSGSTARICSNGNSNSTAPTDSTMASAADGVVWIADTDTLGELLARVMPLLPPSICGGTLVGINARWRIYHYRIGTVYRPHIDGAWTGSGIVNGVYCKDIYATKATTGSSSSATASTTRSDVTSRLTFLIYLNDDFDGGGTTFYAPAHERNCIAAKSVAPIQGSILCFPHGHNVPNVGLVHEGSAVTRGSKYVLRSDVLYEVVPAAATRAVSKS